MFAWVNKSTVSLFWFETPIWLCSWMIQCWVLCLSSYLPSQRTLHFLCVMLFKIENLCDIYAEDWNDLLEILELSIKSPSVSPPISSAFTHNPLFQWYLQSKGNFIKSGYEMLKLSIYCTRFESNYRTNCTGRSSENICISSASAQEICWNWLFLAPNCLTLWITL